MSAVPRRPHTFTYVVTDEQLRHSLRLSHEARLRHLDDILGFVRSASTPGANRARSILRHGGVP